MLLELRSSHEGGLMTQPEGSVPCSIATHRRENRLRALGGVVRARVVPRGVGKGLKDVLSGVDPSLPPLRAWAWKSLIRAQFNLPRRKGCLSYAS